MRFVKYILQILKEQYQLNLDVQVKKRNRSLRNLQKGSSHLLKYQKNLTNMETTFYDKTGRPKIYLAAQYGDSFYTWDGHAVAYHIGEQIFGWRGHHIGWLISGIIYDLNGYKVGSVKEKCPYSVYSEYSKYSKYSQYSRYSRYSAHSKPSLTNSYSDTDLESFISQDKV